MIAIRKNIDECGYNNLMRETYHGCLTDFQGLYEKLKFLEQDTKPVIVAIDGMCGAGKSYLGDLIAEEFHCNIFHMDDYFLPLDMKTEDRLSIPGGNVHYERFKEEVIQGIQEGGMITYQPFLCSVMEYGKTVQVNSTKLTIVEGTYALHPTLIDAYDYKIFLKVDSMIQQARILKRNGKEKQKDFIQKWIPLERLYFDNLHIEEQCDVIYDTSNYERGE